MSSDKNCLCCIPSTVAVPRECKDEKYRNGCYINKTLLVALKEIGKYTINIKSDLKNIPTLCIPEASWIVIDTESKDAMIKQNTKEQIRKTTNNFNNLIEIQNIIKKIVELYNSTKIYDRHINGEVKNLIIQQMKIASGDVYMYKELQKDFKNILTNIFEIRTLLESNVDGQEGGQKEGPTCNGKKCMVPDDGRTYFCASCICAGNTCPEVEEVCPKGESCGDRKECPEGTEPAEPQPGV